jgi:hypothetical protein
MRMPGGLTEALSWLRQIWGRLFFDAVTVQFLRTRNARLTIQEAGSQSFFVVKVQPETNLGTATAKLRFRIKVLSPQTIQVSVYNQSKKQMLVNMTIPNKPTGVTMTLNLDNITLKMYLDDDPSLHRST